MVEIHLRAEREFTGRRRNKALDASLTVKARLQELTAGRIVLDAHNLLCRRPKCRECGAPLPLRTITVRTKDCWNCGQNVTVATGDKDGESLEQDQFTTEEIAFARENGVTLERKFSATVGGKYLASVCTKCDRLQGNHYLFTGTRFTTGLIYIEAERKKYGPCDPVRHTRYCLTHGEYMDYRGSSQCPSCLEAVGKSQCARTTRTESASTPTSAKRARATLSIGKRKDGTN